MIQMNHEAKLSDLWDIKPDSEGFKKLLYRTKI